MIAIEQLLVALRELSDEMFQRGAWLTPSGPVATTFSEQVSQTFDDTGLSDALDSDQCPPELTEQTYEVLKELDRAVRRVDQSLAPKDLLRNPRTEEVRQLARRALGLLESGLSG